MMPECHWDQLLKASACGHLGRIEEGQACVRALLALKPDFAQRGRILIGRYIKFEDIVERVIEGLNAVGIEVRSARRAPACSQGPLRIPASSSWRSCNSGCDPD